ncbi:MAG: methylthioribose-1-phosphate isomerase [Pirellulaceae bacterium]|nr:MAG: methylthioribose-1-phosphate isomerase [Pirellulaceae bacterium]
MTDPQSLSIDPSATPRAETSPGAGRAPDCRAVRPLRWVGQTDGYLVLVDQTRLPLEYREIECHTVEQLWQAIRQLCVRGAPAIGIAAAYGLCLGLQPVSRAPREKFLERLDQLIDYLGESRPTAVNLFWALHRMRRVAFAAPAGASSMELLDRLLEEAHAIFEEDRRMCRAIGSHGAGLLRSVRAVLTHCNTGGLATAEYGTALSIIFTAQDQGHLLHVYVDETRPLWQGARLTAWELGQRGIPVTVICDSMAGWLMRTGRVQAVLVGADRIAANGDTANKIGTYSLAVLARAHNLPFYVAAPSSTFDLTIPNGDAIPIEQRPPDEVVAPFGRRIAPENINVFNPAFDVTPAELVTAIVTERGVIQPVTPESIRRTMGNAA